MNAAALKRVDGAFRDFHAYFSPLLGRRESQEHGSHYVRAPLAQSQDRRNSENLSESVGVSTRSMQRFLTEAPWDDDAVMGRLAPSRRHVPVGWGFLLILQQDWRKKMPQITRPQVYRVVRELLPRVRSHRSIENSLHWNPGRVLSGRPVPSAQGSRAAEHQHLVSDRTQGVEKRDHPESGYPGQTSQRRLG